MGGVLLFAQVCVYVIIILVLFDYYKFISTFTYYITTFYDYYT